MAKNIKSANVRGEDVASNSNATSQTVQSCVRKQRKKRFAAWIFNLLLLGEWECASGEFAATRFFDTGKHTNSKIMAVMLGTGAVGFLTSFLLSLFISEKID